MSCASVTRCCKMYHCVKTLLWNALYRVSTIYCFNMICYNMIRWHEWIFTNVWSTSCHFNPPSAHHTEVTKNIINAIWKLPLPGEFGHASAWFFCPGFPWHLFHVSRTWHLPAYPPVENLRWMWLAWIVEKHPWLQVHLVLRRKVEVYFFSWRKGVGPLKIWENIRAGSCFYHVLVFLNQYGYGSKWLRTYWNHQARTQ